MIAAFCWAGFFAGLLTAYIVARMIFEAGRVAGYLEGRTFLAHRRILLRTTAWLDGRPLEDIGAIWIESNGFNPAERARIEALKQWEAASAVAEECP